MDNTKQRKTGRGLPSELEKKLDVTVFEEHKATSGTVRDELFTTLVEVDQVITIPPSVAVSVYLMSEGIPIYQHQPVFGLNVENTKIISVQLTPTLVGDEVLIYFSTSEAEVSRIPIYELTTDDILNKTNKKGLASGDMFPDPVLPSGPLVLKDWVTLTGDTGFQVDLLEGLDAANLDYNGLALEFKDVRCSGGGGSTYVSLKFKNLGGVDVTGFKSRGSSRSAGGGLAGGGNDYCSLFAAGFGVDHASATVLLGHSPLAGQATWYSEAFIMSSEPTLASDQHLSTVASFYNSSKVKPVELILDSLAGFAGTTFTYRVIRKY